MVVNSLMSQRRTAVKVVGLPVGQFEDCHAMSEIPLTPTVSLPSRQCLKRRCNLVSRGIPVSVDLLMHIQS